MSLPMYPYTNMSDTNLDWIIRTIKELHNIINTFTALQQIKWCGNWDISKAYEQWSIVDTPDHNGYISIKPVPIGVNITDTNYWVKVCDYDALYSAFESRINALEDKTTFLNVKNFGAVGDGVTDDYLAFKNAYDSATNGEAILVPYGEYKLTSNPDDHLKSVLWVIDNGTTFTGNGTGDVTTGHGLFGSTYITNPWLITSGAYKRVSLNGIECPIKGAINGDSFEMMDAAFDSDVNKHEWLNLTYMGVNTGSIDGDGISKQVEVQNQVVNVTGCHAIATEIDVNTFANPNGFNVGLFLTGGGDTKAKTVGIDIQRNSALTAWSFGISVKQCDVGINVDPATCTKGIVIGATNTDNKSKIAINQSENGTDTIFIKRATDTASSGSIIRVLDNAETTTLFHLGVDGAISCSNIASSGVVSANELSSARIKCNIAFGDGVPVVSKFFRVYDGAGNSYLVGCQPEV